MLSAEVTPAVIDGTLLGRPDAAALAQVSALSVREREALELLASGSSKTENTARLYSSLAAVKF